LKGLHLGVDYAREWQEQLQGPVGIAGVERCIHLVDEVVADAGVKAVDERQLVEHE
jgi:hypothetical protein